MGELGELLELIHGARRRWTTVRVVRRDWRHHEGLHRAFERANEDDRRTGRATFVGAVRSGSGTPTPEDEAEMVKLWIDSAGRNRVERGDPEVASTSIHDGPRWWTYSPVSGAMSNEADPEVGHGGGAEADAMLDPAKILGLLDFDVIGRQEVAGRPGVAAAAHPRGTPAPHDWALHELGYGADEYRLVVDSERGVLLQVEARLDGEPFLRTDIVEIAFDEVFADDVFLLQVPPGVVVRSPRDVYPRAEPVTAEEAARRAPFPVLVPAAIPDGWSASFTFAPSTEASGRPPTVVVRLTSPEHLHVVTLHESPEPIHDALDWDEVQREGETYLVFRHGGSNGAVWDVKLDRMGTHVRMSGSVDRDVMLDLAAALRPASKDSPVIP